MIDDYRNTILLVEDEALVAMAEAETLRGHGYEVIIASSGEEAVELIRSGTAVDLVLMDIDLGSGMNGTDAAQIILKENNLPLSFLSSHTEPETVAKTEGITSYGYIVKNSGDMVLLASIKMAFRLWESEEKFRTAFDKAAVGIVLTSTDGRLLRVNDAFAEMLGYRRSEIETINFKSLTHPDDVEKSFRCVEAALDGQGENSIFTKRFIHRNGSVIWTEISTVLLRNRIGEPLHFVTHVQDITGLMKSEAELKESKDRLSSIFKAVPAGIGVVRGTDRIIMEVNEKICAMTGYSRGELIGKSARVLYPSVEDYEYVGSEKYRQIAEQGTGAVETRWKKKNGTFINILLASTPIHSDDISLGVTFSATDITDIKAGEKEAEDALKYEGYLLHTIMDNFPGQIYFKDLESRFIRINKSHAELFGLDNPSEAVGKTDFDFYSRENAEQYFRDEQEIIRTGDEFIKEQKEYWTDKPGRWVLSTKMPFRDGEGKIIGTFGVSIDLTEQKRAESQIEALLAEKELLVKEVQHRIKNTMNTMVSLLSLQAAEVKDEKAVSVLHDAKSRLRSMAVLYDQLYKTENHMDGSVKEYIEQLTDKVVDLFPAGKNVAVSIEIEDFSIDAKRLSTLGMIVNELVTNSMKYAFGQKESGRLSINLKRAGDNYKAAVEDDGPGIPVELAGRTGFGLRMVEALAAELGGEFRFEKGSGARTIIEFPVILIR